MSHMSMPFLSINMELSQILFLHYPSLISPGKRLLPVKPLSSPFTPHNQVNKWYTVLILWCNHDLYNTSCGLIRYGLFTYWSLNLFLIFSCMTSLCLNISTLHSSSLWRINTFFWLSVSISPLTHKHPPPPQKWIYGNLSVSILLPMPAQPSLWYIYGNVLITNMLICMFRLR